MKFPLFVSKAHMDSRDFGRDVYYEDLEHPTHVMLDYNTVRPFTEEDEPDLLAVKMGSIE